MAGQDFFAAKRALMSYLWEYANEEVKPRAAVPTVSVEPPVAPPVEPDKEINPLKPNYKIRENSFS